MGKAYRSWAERRDIIRAMVADSNPPHLTSFDLSSSEEIYFRARSERAIDALARQSSAFKSYYALPTAKPFGYVIGMSALIVAGAVTAVSYLWLTDNVGPKAYPLLGTSATLGVAAIGWAVAGWISHRNTVRQNTNNLLAARFSQATFGEAMFHFHQAFGHSVDQKFTFEHLVELRNSDEDNDRKALAAATYLLNYYEFISAGVLQGDLHHGIVRSNIRGVICFYYDKCEPFIREANRLHPLTFAGLIKLRTHYREP